MEYLHATSRTCLPPALELRTTFASGWKIGESASVLPPRTRPHCRCPAHCGNRSRVCLFHGCQRQPANKSLTNHSIIVITNTTIIITHHPRHHRRQRLYQVKVALPYPGPAPGVRYVAVHNHHFVLFRLRVPYNGCKHLVCSIGRAVVVASAS